MDKAEQNERSNLLLSIRYLLMTLQDKENNKVVKKILDIYPDMLLEKNTLISKLRSNTENKDEILNNLQKPLNLSKGAL